METVINKAIEGGYDKRYIPTIGIDFPRHHTTVTTILMDRDFWQALGKACGWYEYCDNPDHGFIDAMGGVQSSDIGRLGCPGCGHDDERIVPSSRKRPIKYALQFHEINLTQGFDKAVQWLEELVTS